MTKASPGVTAQGLHEGKIEVDGTLDVPGYKLPLSDFVSDAFKRAYVEHVLSIDKWPRTPAMEAPKAEWDNFDATADREMYTPWVEYAKKNHPVDIVEMHIGGVRAAIVTPKDGVKPGNENRVLLHFHGGGFFMGRGLLSGLSDAIPMASFTGMKVITVDYRMAPYHRYPAASEDSEAIYRELLTSHEPAQIGVFGCSAGGMLTGQSVVWYHSKGLPRPGAVGLFCHAPVPFGTRGDSSVWSLTGLPWNRPFEVEAWKMLRGKGYMADVDVSDPRAYPAASDRELARFPPTLLVSGTRAMEMSAAVVAHAKFLKLGVDSQLYLMEGGQHGAYIGNLAMTPEVTDVRSYMARWFDQKLQK